MIRDHIMPSTKNDQFYETPPLRPKKQAIDLLFEKIESAKTKRRNPPTLSPPTPTGLPCGRHESMIR